MNPYAIIGGTLETMYFQYMGKKYKGTSIYRSCRRCNYTGNHKFRRLVPRFLRPFSGKKIFICKNCSSEMLEDGTIITTLWDRIEAFFEAGKYKDTIWELETILYSNEKLTAEERQKIIRLRDELSNINADRDLLKKQVRDLIDRINKTA